MSTKVKPIFPDSAAEVTDTEVKKSRSPPPVAGKVQLVKKGSLSKKILYGTSSVWFLATSSVILWNWEVESDLVYNNLLWTALIVYSVQMLTTRLTKME